MLAIAKSDDGVENLSRLQKKKLTLLSSQSAEEEDDEESLKELKEAKIEVTHKLWLNIVSACEEYKKLFGF